MRSCNHLLHFLPLSNRACLRTIFSLLILFSSVSALFSGEQTVQRTISMRERAMNAEQQLREYRQTALAQEKKARMRGISQSPAAVQLKVNREIQSSSTIFFYDNMESGVNGWTSVTYSGSDLWHQSTLNSSSTTHSWWPGIELQSNYNNSARINNAVVSPSIDLTGAVAPVSLLFTENYATEVGWDYCMVDVSTDGGTNWIHLRGGYGSAPTGGSDGWKITSLDLSAYAGQSINIRFYFDTGDQYFNAFPGWFVDDVIVFDQGGQITGKKFFDVNNNSVKDIDERGVKNWLITATGPVTLTTTTNYRGRYWLTLPLGSYTVSETFEPNWTQTYPPSGTWSINLATPDTIVDSVHFGNYINASFINGIKFHDLNNNNSYDGGDTVLNEWKILLCDTNGTQIDFDRTDSLGEYSLYVFEPGTYIVKEVEKSGWLQTYPPAETYTITIPDLNTDSPGNNFGNYFSPLTNSILGQKFNDRDRNGIMDPGDVGVGGFKIQLYRKGGGNNYNLYRTRTTDSSGFYQFLSLPADTFRVKEVPRMGWWQSYPDSSHSLILNSGETLDSIDFGNYEIVTGSLSGIKYNDADTSGSKDGGETGLSGWDVVITGSTYFNTSVSVLTTTDGSGNYSFTGLWPGNYVVSEVWKSGWRQTQPADLAPYFVNLGVEENMTGIDFGNVADNEFSVSFRTFLPESLALAVDKKAKHKPIVNKADKAEMWITLRNDYADSAVGVRVTLKHAYQTGTLTTSPSSTITPVGTKNRVLDLTFSPALQMNEEITLHYFTKKPIDISVTTPPVYTLHFNDSSDPGLYTSITQLNRNPMPNGLNLLEGTVGNGLKVGLGGPHSVVHLSWKDIIKSLWMKPDRMHIGDPRCLDKFAGTTRSIKKQQRYLTPTKGNNKLFAELIALQANIRGSDLLILPGGFGNLVFDDTTGGGSVLNGLTIREIAAKADSFMSSYKDTVPAIPCAMPAGLAGLSVDSLYAKIRKINSAFSGPVDTTSFGPGLKFAPVAPLSSVPFLRFDAAAAQRASYLIKSQYYSEFVPEEFALYQNYPNPFNPTTTIEFYLPAQSFVTLKVYNMLGQEVATVVDREDMEEGYQELNFDASSLSSGVYFYRLVAEGIPDEETGIAGQTFTSIKKMVLMK